MPEYTVLAVLAVVVVVALELTWLRSGVFRRGGFWVAIAIVVFFQVLVDGWLTKLSAPIVLYDDEQNTGVRFPWDIPVEDFAYGFALVTVTIVLWERAGAPARRAAAARSRPSRSAAPGPDA